VADLSRRSTEPEEMDAPGTDAETYSRCIADLAKVNRLTLTHRPTLRWLAAATRGLPAGATVSILDIACGYGDLLRAIRRWADRRGLSVVLAGLDLNPRSAAQAAAATPPEMTIAYRTGDVFAYAPQPLPDLIVSSQFAHHLDDAEVVRFVRWLDAHAGLLRVSAAGPRGGLAPDRAPGWADFHRPQLPAGGVGGAAGVGGNARRGALALSLPLHGGRAEMTVLVAGGGLAGAAAACLLARAGQPVRVIERAAQPVDKVCGAFVSAEAQLYLRHLGLDLAALGGAPITGLRLVRGDAVVSCRLPFAGLGLSRLVLDEALLRHAAQCGAQVARGQAFGVAERTDTLFLATGKHDLRGLRRKAANVPDLVGFKLGFRLSEPQQAALAGHVEILLLDRGYAGLQLVEHGMANLCLLVERARLQQAGGDWDGLLDDLRRTAPHLRTRLAGAAPLARRPLSIFRVPYGFVHRPGDDDPPGVYRLGDQMGVIPSFTGDGMSIALHSAAVAAAVFLSGGTAAAYHRRIRRDIAGQIGRAGTLYRVGSAPSLQPALMRLAAVWPGGLRLAASVTRVPPGAVARILHAPDSVSGAADASNRPLSH
jgi:hypothetical protein